MLAEIEAGGKIVALRYASEFDRYGRNVVLTRDEIEAASNEVPQRLKNDIPFA